jgi:signal transduction histidine kinase
VIRESVKAIKRAGNNLMVIINDILDFSKLKQIK